MVKFSVTEILHIENVDSQDGGSFKSIQLAPHDDLDDGLAVRVVSFDEAKKHPWFFDLMGQKVRITIEVVE